MDNLLNISQKWLCAAFFIIFTAPAFAQQVEVGLRMDVDKRQVEVGESLTLKLEFKQVGTGNMPAMGRPQIPASENFEIGGSSSASSFTMVNNQVVATSTTNLKLVATKVGTATLGPALLLYEDAQGQKKELKSNVATVMVVEKTGFSIFGKKKAADPQPNQPQANPNSPTPPAGDDLRGLKPLVPESNMFIKLMFWLMLLGAIVIFVWRMLKRPARSSAVPLAGKAAQLKDAWKKLGNEDLSGKEFCLGLSNLVRECLQYRFNFPAVDYTTEEILKILPESKLTESESEAVEKCLRTCDRVLYADANLTGRDNLRSLCQSLLPKAQKY